MIELDTRLSALRGQAREFAAELRPYALELDRDPDAVDRMLDLGALRTLGRLQLPPAYQPEPLVVGGHSYYLMSAIERVVFLMELARGDAGAVLAAPGAPMAGVVVAALGDERQRDRFFGTLLAEPTWTFFALSEPHGGSDAAAMRTRLVPTSDTGPSLMIGTKRYVGNATRARLGVAFAARGTGPLAATAVLVEAGTAGVSATPLPTLGLRGAGLGELVFDGALIAPDQILGSHLPATRNGLWSWLRTFNLLRPVVAALGVGIAQAAHDYVLAERATAGAAARDQLAGLNAEIDAVRQLTLSAAMAADADPSDGERASAAKVRAAALAVRATRTAAGLLGPGALLDHRYLEKLIRDARGIEFMEGPTNVQLLDIFARLSRRGGPGRPRPRTERPATVRRFQTIREGR